MSQGELRKIKISNRWSIRSYETASTRFLVRDEGGEQRPIFYVNRSLLDAKISYTAMEKLAIFVVTAAQNLRPYFQSHSIVVMTTPPLRSFHSPNQSERLTRWTVELSK